jgi:acetylglutamate kinase
MGGLGGPGRDRNTPRNERPTPGGTDRDGKVITRLKVAEAKALIANGTISGGMIPKVETAIDAVEKGVHAAVILDGRIPHVLLLELFTEHGAGTLIAA